MSKSTWDDPRITAYVLGELSGEEKSAFEAQCDSDSRLAAAVDEARGVTGQLQNLYASESTPPLDVQRRNAIVESGGSIVQPSSESSWRVPSLILAVAAVLLLLVGLAPWLRQQDTTASVHQELKQKSPALRSEASRQRQLESLIEETEASVDQPLAMSMDESSSDPRVQEFSSESTAAPGAKPSAPSESPSGSMANPRGRLQDAEKLAAKAPQSDEGRESRDKVVNGSSLPSRSEPYKRPASHSAPGPAPIASESDLYRADQKHGSIKPGKSRNMKEAVDLDDDVLTIEAEDIASNRNKRDLSRVEKTIEDVESKMRGQSKQMAAAGTARPVIPMPQASKQKKGRLQKPSPMDLGGAVAGSGVAMSGGAQFVPSPGKRPMIQIDEGFAAAIPEGRGPGISGDQFEPIIDNPFKRVSEAALSTFSVDVDTASYSKTRDFLLRGNQLPRPDAVRIEELINYFEYDYKAPRPEDEHPFATHVEITDCPWNAQHRLARIGLKGKTMTAQERPPCNLVFLLDTSGSMNAPNKLPLVIEGMQMLIDQLDEKDQVAITVYAGSAGLVLDSTSAKNPKKIRKALTQLSAGGSTNGGAGIALAYQTARDNFIADGVNRVILCTDGDFNVGTTGTDALVRMVEEEAKGGVFLSVLGFGMGNHNDAMLEKVSGRGNGNYAFIDTRNEAHKVLVDQTSGTLVTIAKDVKLQIEFNPKHVAQYRLIGYENRILAKEDFNDDKKDAGEIGAGHAVTALYELVPAGEEADASQPKVDELKYQTKSQPTNAAESDELMTLKLRYKQPDGDTSTLLEIPVANSSVEFEKASDDVRFAAAVAGFGMQLRRSEYAGTWTLSDVQTVAKSAKGEDDYQLRTEFVELVRKASELMGEE